MKRPLLWAVSVWLLALNQTINAQESSPAERIREMSPDKEFGVRISCSSEPEDPDKIDPDLITAVELVSLPSKNIVVNLGPDYENLIWSKDSNWFAYALPSGSRVTDTYVYHRSGDDFTRLETGVQVDGVLLLEQFDIFRGGNGKDATYRFTARFDEKTGKFRIISKKKIPSKE